MSEVRVFCVFIFLLIPLQCLSQDHGDLSSSHIQVAKKFIDENFKDSTGHFSVVKIRAFLERLEREKEQMAADNYETVLLEDIEVYIRRPERSQKHGEKKSHRKRNKMTAAYHHYLIPKMTDLLLAVEKEEGEGKCESLMDDFIRGYLPFFIPNAHRSRFPYEVDVFYVLKRFIIPYSISPSLSKSESFNLRVHNENKRLVSETLEESVQEGSYLSPDQIKMLYQRGFDLSQIDPGTSALWEDPRPLSYEQLTEANPDDYPRAEEKVHFEEIRYRGAGSVKFKVSFFRNGKKKSLKLKIGLEVHTDIILSRLHQLMGFNQDRMQYSPSVKMWLGKVTYESFLSRLVNKYGVDSAIRWINGHGEENGEHWVLLNDVLFETRPEHEVRVTPFDVSAWDLANRREYRSLLLIWSWLGLNDAKLANFKYLIEKQRDQTYKVRVRFHDQGVSLGGRLLLRRPNDVLSLTEYYKVDAFQDTFLNKKKNKILIKWNDFANRKRNFKSATWSDLKWAARRIASIKESDLERVLKDAGTPDSVASLFAYKLKKRRNEVVSYFGLKNEYGLFSIPKKLKNFQAPGVRNGKILARTFEGHNDQVINQKTWLTILPSLLTFDTPIHQWDTLGANNQVGLQGVGASGIIKPTEARVTRLAASPGLGILLWRKVLPNTDQFSQGNKAHIYRVEDVLSIEIGASIPKILETILRKIPGFSLNANIRLTGYEIRVVRYVNKDTEGWKLPFPKPIDMLNPKKYAAMKLNPLEIIGTYLYYGPHVSASANIKTAQPVIQSGGGFLCSATRHVQNYYMRDQYGQIHAYQDQLSEAAGALSLDLATIDLFEATFPLFRIRAEGQAYQYHFSDQVIPIDEKTRDTGQQVLTPKLRSYEYELLKNHEGFKQKWVVESHGEKKSGGLGALFLFNFDNSHKKSTSRVKDPQNKKYHFYFSETEQSHSSGAEKLRIDFGQSDVLVENRKKTRLTTEVSLSEKKSLHIVRIEDFYRTRTRKKIELLIADLNRRFSHSQDGDFYRDYFVPKVKKESKYRKIYAMTRIFINGEGLQDKLISMSKREIKRVMWKHFQYTRSPLSRSFRVLRSYSIWKKLKKNSMNFRKQRFTAEKWLVSLKIAHYGVRTLETLLGEENLFVMGDVSGILQSYSTVQDLQMVQRRRFAGKSWGQAEVVPPLQKFLRYQRVIPPTSNVSNLLSDTEIFGKLEVPTARNLQVTFDRANEF
ncbi:MAG: hypothetical protein AB8C84_10735 [Oligoflexales bacterium]